jgi:hypothetical protein
VAITEGDDMTSTIVEVKVRENRLRAAADRQGLRLMKSRRRDPRALDYGLFALFDPQANTYAAGCDSLRSGFHMNLDDVEQWLTDGPVGA